MNKIRLLRTRLLSEAVRKAWMAALPFLAMGTVVTACSDDDDEMYPSVISEFVELYSDSDGNGSMIVTDDGDTYIASNPITGLQSNVVYRIVCGYELSGTYEGEYPVVKIYTATNVTLLKEKEDDGEEEAPLSATSVWLRGNYINFNLAPKTQGGTHEWGFCTDSVTTSDTGETVHLSLYHRQPDDPYSYSTTVYASLPLSYINKELEDGDSIWFTILTFSGEKTWKFAY